MSAARPSASPTPSAERGPRRSPLAGGVEWLLTDGRGGYACGAADALARRRYHGLWVARPGASSRRYLVVADLDERVIACAAGDASPRTTHLMHAHWRGDERPSAPAADVDFARSPLPCWTFQSELGEVERTVALQRADGDAPPQLLVRWRNLADSPVRLEVRPLLGWCDADHLPEASSRFVDAVEARGASWGFRPTDDLPTLWLTVDGVAGFRAEAEWYRGFYYATDHARGYDHFGDRWTPGVLELDLGPGGEGTAAFSLETPCADARAAFEAARRGAVERLERPAVAAHPSLARLEAGADDFFYRGVGGRLGVIAGYPWFGEWGRDVFLALPGLSIARGRLDLCEQVLVGCLPFLDRGLLPNIYGEDVAKSHYGSCDAALWFALAVMRYDDAGGDQDLMERKLLPALRGLVASYQRGAPLGLKVGEDGLLRAGSADLNATWMDARTSAGPVTPRHGMPVELHAVWYALLAFLADRDDAGGALARLRDDCGAAFLDAFWSHASGCLADRVHEGVQDTSIRPNMLVGAALPRSPLSRDQRAAVVAVARDALVTPCGLRTLSPDDERYVGAYGGGVEERDHAYHQGTVWPWLAGFYVEAALRAAPDAHRPQVAASQLEWLDALLARELERGGADHVNEVFDGDPPHRPGGTFAQAWNTGELLRAHSLCREAVAAGASEPS
ncbi:MAG: amylo-alpha-1,6-glucosidase [Planctomycetota bacterium]|nr:amylo-alpha-1,6-glucosidase [Planctomycetota bacterium]